MLEGESRVRTTAARQEKNITLPVTLSARTPSRRKLNCQPTSRGQVIPVPTAVPAAVATGCVGSEPLRPPRREIRSNLARAGVLESTAARDAQERTERRRFSVFRSCFPPPARPARLAVPGMPPNPGVQGAMTRQGEPAGGKRVGLPPLDAIDRALARMSMTRSSRTANDGCSTLTTRRTGKR